ncbi:N-terminal phage integrase SAM-like domain-containing protein, partial [Ruminococcus sp.]|uniref:N-terminal phage integrase SAM-like domain-containing protein n=1 Tax=Ruminococcus sp. TaxID=41978 RepID=UPI0025FCAFD7
MANITNRNGKFLIRVFTGRDISGKQLFKSTTYVPPNGTSQKKAEKMAQEYAFEFESHCKGYAQLNENMRFSELAEWYFENYAPEELKPTTILNYKSQYRNHIAPILSNKKLKDITTPMLTGFLKVLGKDHHLNATSVRKVYIVVQSI